MNAYPNCCYFNHLSKPQLVNSVNRALHYKQRTWAGTLRRTDGVSAAEWRWVTCCIYSTRAMGGICGPQRGELIGGRNAAHSDEIGGYFWGRPKLWRAWHSVDAKGVGRHRGCAPCCREHTNKTRVKPDIPTKSYTCMSTSWFLGNVYTVKSCKG